MTHVLSTTGARVEFDTCGSGPPLVLVHGSFSNHRTNSGVRLLPLLSNRFTVHAVARRGRGQDRCHDRPLPRRRSARTSRRSCARWKSRCCCSVTPTVRRSHSPRRSSCPGWCASWCFHEAPWPSAFDAQALTGLEALASAGNSDQFSCASSVSCCAVPAADLQALRSSDTPATHRRRCPGLARRPSCSQAVPVRTHEALQVPAHARAAGEVGSERPRELYVTDALAAALPDARVESLQGQAHEGMTTRHGRDVRRSRLALPARLLRNNMTIKDANGRAVGSGATPAALDHLETASYQFRCLIGDPVAERAGRAACQPGHGDGTPVQCLAAVCWRTEPAGLRRRARRAPARAMALPPETSVSAPTPRAVSRFVEAALVIQPRAAAAKT